MQEEKEKNNDINSAQGKGNLGKMLLRLAISIIAFVALIKYGKIDIGDAIKHFLTVNPIYFVLAIVSYFITLFLSGVRFFIASRPHGFTKTISQCIQLNFVGTFFNNFLPTTVGGDALRGYYLKKGTNIPISKTAGCILCERYTGMVVLFWIASVVFLLKDFGLINKVSWNLPKQMAWFAHLGSIGSIFIVPFLPTVKAKIFGTDNWVYKKFIDPVIIYWKDSDLIVKIFVLSLLLQLSVIACHYFVAISLGISIPISYYFIFYPLTTIAGFLIPSLNGLGVREGGYIYFLTKVGIDSEEGLAFSVGILIILLISSIVGGITYLLGDFREEKTVSS